MVVPDATRDKRFAASPMVTGPHHIRFYAGVTLRDADGFALGTLAVADTVPRVITEQQKDSLKGWQAWPLTAWSSRKASIELREAVATTEVARQHAVSDHAELRQVIECLPQAIVLLDAQNRLRSLEPELREHVSRYGRAFQAGHQLSRQYYRMALRNDRYYQARWMPPAEETWIKNRLDRLDRNAVHYRAEPRRLAAGSAMTSIRPLTEKRSA